MLSECYQIVRFPLSSLFSLTTRSIIRCSSNSPSFLSLPLFLLALPYVLLEMSSFIELSCMFVTCPAVQTLYLPPLYSAFRNTLFIRVQLLFAIWFIALTLPTITKHPMRVGTCHEYYSTIQFPQSLKSGCKPDERSTSASFKHSVEVRETRHLYDISLQKGLGRS